MPAPWDPLGWARQKLQGVTPTQVMPRGGPPRGVAPQTVNVGAAAVRATRMPGLRVPGGAPAAALFMLPQAARDAYRGAQGLYEGVEGLVRGRPLRETNRRMSTPGYQSAGGGASSLPPSARVPSQYPQGVPGGGGASSLPPSARVPSQYPQGVPTGAAMAAPVTPGHGTVPVGAPGTPARERAYRSAVQQGRAAAPPAPTLPAARAAQAAAPATSGAAPAGRPGWTPEQIAAAEARAAGKASRDPRSPDYWAQADIAAWAAANKDLADALKRRVGYQEPSPGGTYVDASALPKDLPAMAQAPIQWQPVGPEQTSPSFTTQGVELPAYAPGDLLDPSRRPPAGSMTSQPIQWQAPTPEQMSPSFTVGSGQPRPLWNCDRTPGQATPGGMPGGNQLPPYSASDLLRRRGVRNSEMYPIL